MEQERTDRRVRRTRARLRQALTQLLLEKEIRSITVRELTDRADVNRGTFYAHYRDIYDLLEQTENELFGELRAMLDAYTPQHLRRDTLPILRDVFRFVHRNQALCRVFLGRQEADRFFQRLNGLIFQKCREEWSGIYPLRGEMEQDYALEFVVAGIVGMVRTWSLRGFRESPEAMAQLAKELILSGLTGPAAGEG